MAATTLVPPELGWAALKAMSEALAIKDAELRYVWVNAAFCRMFSVAASDVLGATDEALAPILVPHPDGDRRVLSTGTADERYETLTFDNGRLCEVLMTTSRVRSDAGVFLVRVLHDITEVAAANHSLVETTEQLSAESVELRDLARRDPLTGLLNLRGFQAAAPAALEAAQHRGAVLMLDLDNFKPINDGYGHDVGDAVLRTLADALRESTRRRRDVIARLGGDEFVVAMPALPEDEARVIVERIRTYIAQHPIDAGTGTLVPAVSIGVALRQSGTPLDLAAWRRKADAALYAAKRAGKDQAVIDVTA